MPSLYRSCLIYSLEIKKDSLTRKYSFAFGVAGNWKKRSFNSNIIFHIANYNLFEEKEPTVGCGVTIVTSMAINFKNITELCLWKRYRNNIMEIWILIFFFQFTLLFFFHLSLFFFIYFFLISFPNYFQQAFGLSWVGKVLSSKLFTILLAFFNQKHLRSIPMTKKNTIPISIDIFIKFEK
jgi:hypothetical protein